MQDPAEGTAFELAEQIKVRLSTLHGRSSRKAQARGHELVAVSPPFTVPDSWVWCTLAEIGIIGPRNQAPDDHPAAFVPMPLIPAEYGRPSTHEVRPWGAIKKAYTHFADGDVGLAKITPCFENGKSTVFRDLTGGIGAGTTELHIVRPVLVHPNYVLIFLKSAHFVQSGIARMTGTAGQKRIPTDYFKLAAFPLPPLPEQHRIVAKVDELMALCEQLEAAENDRDRQRDRMTEAALHRIKSAPRGPDTSEFHEAAAFALHHLPRVIAKPAHVAALRQTIRDLAVLGRLVRQDTEDEPASAFLELIAQAKGQGQQRSQPHGAIRSNADLLPSSWELVSLADLVTNRDGERVPVSKEERSQRDKVYDYYGASGVIDKIDNYIFDKPLLLIGEDGANLISRSTPIAFIARGKYWVNNHAHVLDAISEPFLQYLELYINAIDLKPYVTGTAQPKMNQAKMNSIRVSVPPEAEQHRIVAKVNELMLVCDELERCLMATQTTRAQFLEAVLHEALAEDGVDSERALAGAHLAVSV